MAQKIRILVATMGGTAEMLADEVAAKLQDGGLASSVYRMEEVSIADLDPGLYLICSSTYGVGEIPTNGVALYESLRDTRPNLSGVQYGVIALGDSLYPQTFCFGGKRFDELLQSLGARRIGERLEHDSRSPTYPEEAAAAWLDTWIPLTLEACS